jgi:hypothetical protein
MMIPFYPKLKKAIVPLVLWLSHLWPMAVVRSHKTPASPFL